jgi:hypothetical protein
MILFRLRRTTSTLRASFKPELEVLEGRNLLSLSGAVDAIHNSQMDADKFNADRLKLIYDSLVNYFSVLIPGQTFGPISSAQIKQDQQTLANDIAMWNSDNASFWNNLITSAYIPSGPNVQQQMQQQAPRQSTTQQPSASWAGTYSGVLTPVDEGESGGSAPRTVTVTINRDGSGNISISPFEEETLYGRIPSGSVSVSTVDNVVTLNLNITVSLNVTITGAGSIQGNQLTLISLDAFDGQYDYDVAVSGPLNKQ